MSPQEWYQLANPYPNLEPDVIVAENTVQVDGEEGYQVTHKIGDSINFGMVYFKTKEGIRGLGFSTWSQGGVADKDYRIWQEIITTIVTEELF